MKLTEIYGCPCYAFESYQDAYALTNSIIGKGGYSAAINAEKIVNYQKDKKIKELLDGSVLPIPDGVGAVYGMKILHNIKSIKLDLPGLILDLANDKKLKVFLFGASEESNKNASIEVNNLYPYINIVGRLNGFYKSLKEIEDQLLKLNPDIVLLALGSPKQEMVAQELNVKFPKILFVGCGGRFDILSGRVKRAPAAWQKLGLEWLYRLSKQPKRYKRQKAIPILGFKLTKSLISKLRIKN